MDVNSPARVPAREYRLELYNPTRIRSLVSAQVSLSRRVFDGFVGIDARGVRLPNVHLSTLERRTAARRILHDGQGKIKWRSIEDIGVGRIRGDIGAIEFLVDEIRTHGELGSQNAGG